MSQNEPTYIKGRNWGNLSLTESEIEFTGDNKKWFKVPYNSLTNVLGASNKNEITFEFNLEDENKNELNLCEMRLYVPDKENEKEENKSEKKEEENSENENENEKKANKITSAALIQKEIIKKSKIGVVSNSIACIREIQMITPRGKIDLYFMETSLKIHGQTHNNIISYKNIQKVFLVPKSDGHNHFLIIKLISALSQGNTSYNFLIFQIKNDAEEETEIHKIENSKINIDLPEKLVGKIIDNTATLFNKLVNISIITTSKNYTFSKGPYIKCFYKTNEGVLYILERSLLFVHKPVIFISHDEIRKVDCSRINDSNMQQRTFDMTIVTKEDIQFTGIEKVELEQISSYFQGKKIKINLIDENKNTVDMPTMSKRRTRAPVTDQPMELPSEEDSFKDDGEYESGDSDDDDDEEEEDGEYEDTKKKNSKK